MTQAELAEKIAREAHAGQTEESTGDDYIRHVERVVGMVNGDDNKAVAWLHDVLEDCPSVRAFDLKEAGISLENIHSVLLLTRAGPEETYEQYIKVIWQSRNWTVLTVKIADLRDHFRPGCPERLRERYVKAWAVLSDEPCPEFGEA